MPVELRSKLAAFPGYTIATPAAVLTDGTVVCRGTVGMTTSLIFIQP